MKNPLENQDLEIDLIIQAIYQKYGHDFRDYARASIKRRLLKVLQSENMRHLGELQHKLIYDPDFFRSIIQAFSIHVTELFRDAEFYLALKNKVISQLKKKEHLKVWIAGCSSGEEAFSVAILFYEAWLYDKTDFYATDMNRVVLEEAKKGYIARKNLPAYSEAYHKIGGKANLSDYLVFDQDQPRLKPKLMQNIVFADHNLVHDQAFAEMDLIVCRNVLIYFNQTLQQRVLELFRQSLVPQGFLGLGQQEGLHFTSHANEFKEICSDENIYQWRGV